MQRIKGKKVSFYFLTEKGLTLIEILASITIFFILILSFLTMFVQSSRINSFSEDIIGSTYLAESNIETIENLISSSTSIDSLAVPMVNNGYNQVVNGCSIGTCYEKNSDGHYISVQFIYADSGNQSVVAKVKVYKDSTKTKEEAQMELALPWKK
ncbi:hypothetical protein [Bacillus sp. EB600]|uniref:type IV pilus modification PilV family protein n=1 Tax=Bacillus sp. EB600 TaxID=2806345 RepID=UPI00210B3BF4|nr:hypothetical protein [Bacillus sp. EB600]MCQ6278275.1 hypothetical protein [Bacillus sp. EB600]